MSKPFKQYHQNICDNVQQRGRKIGEHAGKNEDGSRVIARSDSYGAWTVRRDLYLRDGVPYYASIIIFANRIPIARYVSRNERPARLERIYYDCDIIGMERTA